MLGAPARGDGPRAVFAAREGDLVLCAGERDPGGAVDGRDGVDGDVEEQLGEFLRVERLESGVVGVARVDDLDGAGALGAGGVEQRPEIDVRRADDARELWPARAFGEQPLEPGGGASRRCGGGVVRKPGRQRRRAGRVAVLVRVGERELVQAEARDGAGVPAEQAHLERLFGAGRHVGSLLGGYGALCPGAAAGR